MHNLGHTTSSNKRDHLLLSPDSFIRTPLPGLTGGMAIVHVAPQAGAAFTQMTVELEAKGTLQEGPTQRLIYVLEGSLSLQEPSSKKLHRLTPGSYAYLPPEHPHTLTARTRARVAVIDKPFVPLEGVESPEILVGHEQELKATPLNGDPDLQVRALLPDSPRFDFACNTMTYKPGAALSQVEIHYMEHGLLMLEGGGIYRLGDSWYPTQAGDFIWMAPYCPQWFGAIGKKPAKYLIYKDFNRHTLLA
ncbi:MAG: (S)-ureidoglycine aminohydrolase [Acidobacteriaceae bacterium]|nr:(S)-ureidoglycine aminohydrolase [Acidobacteriaceae bacterium]